MTPGDFDCVSCGSRECSFDCYPRHKRRFTCHNHLCAFRAPLGKVVADDDRITPIEEPLAMPIPTPARTPRLRAHPPPARVEIWIQNAHYEPSRRRTTRSRPFRAPAPPSPGTERVDTSPSRAVTPGDSTPDPPGDPPSDPPPNTEEASPAETGKEPTAEADVEDTPKNQADDEAGGVRLASGGNDGSEELRLRGGGGDQCSCDHSSESSHSSDEDEDGRRLLEFGQPTWTIVSMETLFGDEAELRRRRRTRG